MEPTITKHDFTPIDIAKVVMATLVVALHTGPLIMFGSNVNEIFSCFTAIAVPFFFVANGYFMFRNGVPTKSSFSRQIRKLFRLYLLWNVVYLPLKLVDIVNATNPKREIVALVRNFLVRGGAGDHLWYLPASMVALCTAYFLCKKKVQMQVQLSIGILLYIIGLSFDRYYGFFRNLPIWDISLVYYPTKIFLVLIGTTRNGVFDGLVFVMIGVYLSKIDRTPRASRCWGGLMCSMILLYFEQKLTEAMNWPRSYDMAILLMPYSYFLFAALLSIDLKKNPDTKKLRECSTIMYLTHYWFSMAIRIVRTYNEPINILMENSLLRFFIVYVLSVSLSILIISFTRKKEKSKLRLLF